MTFYHALAPYYNQLFPANDKQLSFISSYFPSGSELLDMGAGTGNVAYALAEAGYHVMAAEPDPALRQAMIDKQAGEAPQLHISDETMQQLGQSAALYDGIYCIGNTLVHLSDIQEVSQFFSDAHDKLRPNGALLIQIVNYEKVLTLNNFSFPVVEREQFAFERKYDLVDGKVMFTATLTAGDQTATNTIPLLPLTVHQLLPLLEQSGFQNIEYYADFKKQPYTADAPALIIAAHKLEA